MAAPNLVALPRVLCVFVLLLAGGCGAGVSVLLLPLFNKKWLDWPALREASTSHIFRTLYAAIPLRFGFVYRTWCFSFWNFAPGKETERTRGALALTPTHK